MSDAPEILLAHRLKALKRPTFLREHKKLPRQCATEGLDHVRYLARPVELELIDQPVRGGRECGFISNPNCRVLALRLRNPAIQRHTLHDTKLVEGGEIDSTGRLRPRIRPMLEVAAEI